MSDGPPIPYHKARNKNTNGPPQIETNRPSRIRLNCCHLQTPRSASIGVSDCVSVPHIQIVSRTKVPHSDPGQHPGQCAGWLQLLVTIYLSSGQRSGQDGTGQLPRMTPRGPAPCLWDLFNTSTTWRNSLVSLKPCLSPRGQRVTDIDLSVGRSLWCKYSHCDEYSLK